VKAVDVADRLLSGAQRGSTRDFTLLVRATQAGVWRFCEGVVGRADADDATQETYLAAWRGLSAFRGESSARTWLYAIARRASLAIVYRRQRASRLPAVEADELGARDTGGALEVSELIAGLDVDRRVAFVLTQVVGLSYDEAAQACDCPVGTIRSRVSRARAQLIDLVAEPRGEVSARSLA
jgi:RNA polymerase sigma-70 factor, ECF subfamily